jgi:glutamate--cysteine ligase catalytic subunit
LKVGKPLTWEESAKHSKYIREHGVRQFLNTYHRVKHLANDRLFYGDEVEHALVKLDANSRHARLSLRGAEVMAQLRRQEQGNSEQAGGCAWHQEYGSWMLESTPSLPYGGYTSSLLQVEQNMRLRRSRLLSALADDEIAPTMVNFPLMGVEGFVSSETPPGVEASLSDSVPDACINPHPRFGTLTANIRARRGSKVDVRVPLFQDTATPEFASPEAGSQPSINMDCMAFGMGMCCLQVTFQAADMEESTNLYDQLAVLAPIMLALTAATPIFKGRLADTDARWNAISASVDDRTPAERGIMPEAEATPNKHMVGGGVRRLSKSRYDSISAYLHRASHVTDETWAQLNDVACEVDEEVRNVLLSEGVDAPLARHVAHLFVRDPLVAFDGAVEEVDDDISTEHFESIQSTNWQTMRWKPPPKQDCGAPHIGWRTEFRSMELQLTDFENAAFTAFIVLVSRALLVFDLDMKVPLSMVDENMGRAHRRGAVTTEKFWFSSDLCRPGVEAEEMSMAEIMLGKGDHFPGLLPLCYSYLQHIDCDAGSFPRIHQYLTFIEKRAAGELMTPATWMRNFVRKHPEYKHDSVVTPCIAHDLVKACNDIGLGRLPCPALLGQIVIEPVVKEMAYARLLDSIRLGPKQRCELLQRYRQRAAAVDGPASTPTATAVRRQCRLPSSKEGVALAKAKAAAAVAFVAGA